VILGIGDDAAVLAPSAHPIVVTCDTMVEGTHFRFDLSPPRLIGRKTLAVNLSDVAAMGARPRAALLMMSLRSDLERASFDGIAQGLLEIAYEYDAALVGGDTTRTAGPVVLSVSLDGEAMSEPLLRSGARPGDRVYVTGALGESALGLRILLDRPELAPAHSEVVARHLDPTPRVAVGLALTEGRLASACIDVSDGLVQDAGHIARRSGVSMRLELDRLPRSAAFRAAAGALGLSDWLTPLVAGGEDYELLFTAPADRRVPESLAGVPVTKIGECHEGLSGEVTLVASDGSELALTRKGWEHF
jgi:thiamine-monophosphate kinase